jgi:hypothetical protein
MKRKEKEAHDQEPVTHEEFAKLARLREHDRKEKEAEEHELRHKQREQKKPEQSNLPIVFASEPISIGSMKTIQWMSAESGQAV